MTDPLSLQRIQALYAAYDSGHQPGWTAWIDAATAAVQWAQGLSNAQLADPAVHERLWNQREAAGAGSSEHLSVQGVLGDAAFSKLLVALRRKVYSPETPRRAQELQAAYDALLARLRQCLAGSTPEARLIRIVAFLRPQDTHLGLSWASHMDVRRLLVGRRRLKRMEAPVIARARLREALGPEPDLREHMVRATFCWWLHEHAGLIAEGGTPGSGSATTTGGGGTEPGGDDRADTLELWPLDRQVRWPMAFKGALRTLRMPVRECLDEDEHGRSFVDLQGAVHDELGPTFAADRYLRRLLRHLRNYGMLTERDGRYLATSAGEQFLDSPDPLIEALIVRVVGMAALLRALEGGEQPTADLSRALAVYVAGDGGARLWSRLAHIAQQAGLVDKRGEGRRVLTALGRDWARRLPATIPVPDFSDTPGGDEGTDEGEGPPAAPHPDFATLWAAFQRDPALHGYIFKPDQVRSLYAAWNFHPRKRFVIISGLSGTGKTQLLLHTARLVCEAMGLDPARHLALVPVRPDWRDPTGLLGYYNALHAEPTFQVEPALQLVLRASKNPHLPYFLVLDEMNLARVERYFAPFLSTMETGGDLQLHAEAEEVNGVPPTVPWPANLRIGGTVNMDETTHPFSDKVLDRAFTLEFWDVHLPAFLAARPARTAADAPVEQALLAVQAELVPIRRHVGYRTAGEVLDWVAACRAADPAAPLAALLDQAVFSKVLPRLRGTESTELVAALERLEQVCTERSLDRCRAKLAAMRARLQDTGVTSFWS